MYLILCLALILPSALADCKCGRKAPQTRILGGETAKDGQFPWMAFIHRDIFYSDGNRTSDVCGGSIINSEWVLTAAQCVSTLGKSRDGSYISKVEFFVAVGMADVSPMYAESLYEVDNCTLVPKQQLPPGIHHVSKAIEHETYSRFLSGSFNGDIALLKVAKAFEFSPKVAPVCLETLLTEVDFYPTLEIAGWGSQGTNKSIEVHLRHTTVSEIKSKVYRYTDYKECSKDVRISKRNEMCTTKGEHGVCSGDTGGPYVVNKGGVHYQVALASFIGGTCEDPRYPNVETRVSAYNTWIRMKANSGYWCTP